MVTGRCQSWVTDSVYARKTKLVGDDVRRSWRTHALTNSPTTIFGSNQVNLSALSAPAYNMKLFFVASIIASLPPYAVVQATECW